MSPTNDTNYGSQSKSTYQWGKYQNKKIPEVERPTTPVFEEHEKTMEKKKTSKGIVEKGDTVSTNEMETEKYSSNVSKRKNIFKI